VERALPQPRWLVREQGIAAVPPGFRSSFRDWAAEKTNQVSSGSSLNQPWLTFQFGPSVAL